MTVLAGKRGRLCTALRRPTHRTAKRGTGRGSMVFLCLDDPIADEGPTAEEQGGHHAQSGPGSRPSPFTAGYTARGFRGSGWDPSLHCCALPIMFTDDGFVLVIVGL